MLYNILMIYNINCLEALCGGPIWVFQSNNKVLTI